MEHSWGGKKWWRTACCEQSDQRNIRGERQRCGCHGGGHPHSSTGSGTAAAHAERTQCRDTNDSGVPVAYCSGSRVRTQSRPRQQRLPTNYKLYTAATALLQLQRRRLRALYSRFSGRIVVSFILSAATPSCPHPARLREAKATLTERLVARRHEVAAARDV